MALSDQVAALSIDIKECTRELQDSRVIQAKHNASVEHIAETVTHLQKEIWGNGTAGIKAIQQDVLRELKAISIGQSEIKNNCSNVRNNYLACSSKTTIQSVVLKALPTIFAALVIGFVLWLMGLYKAT